MTITKTPEGSTSQVTVGLFKAHGQVDFRVEGNVLYYVATGPFNKELVDCLAIAQMEFLRESHPIGPWVSICTMQISAITSPEGIARYTELMRLPKPPELSPIATAFVIGPEVEGGKLMAPHFDKIYASIARPFQTFATEQEARVWALEQLAQAHHTPADQA